MLNREDVRRVLVARERVLNIYTLDGVEDVDLRVLLEDVLKQVIIMESQDEKKDKKK